MKVLKDDKQVFPPYQACIVVRSDTLAANPDVAVVPDEYMNFELALAIVDGCRNAICMADAHDPNTLIQKLEIASESLANFQSGAAESSVTAARTHIDETIAVLRPFVAPDL